MTRKRSPACVSGLQWSSGCLSWWSVQLAGELDGPTQGNSHFQPPRHRVSTVAESPSSIRPTIVGSRYYNMVLKLWRASSFCQLWTITRVSQPQSAAFFMLRKQAYGSTNSYLGRCFLQHKYTHMVRQFGKRGPAHLKAWRTSTN